MAAIDSIRVLLQTADVIGADTDGWVYLGLCGKEFRLARPDIDDYQVGAETVYRLGENANVEDPIINNPQWNQLEAGDVSEYPVYIRFQPLHSDDRNDDWQLRQVVVQINNQEYPLWTITIFPPDTVGIWLGLKYGSIVYLKEFPDPVQVRSRSLS